MSWSIFNNTHLSHTNGAQIHLICGTWQKPVEINPKMPESFDAVEQAKLIKQGLVFARNKSLSSVKKARSRS